MSWFEDQIKLRKKRDNSNLADAIEDIASSVLHRRNTAFGDNRKSIKNALDEILRYHHIRTREIPDETIDELDEQMDYLFRPHGIMHRNVRLEKGWYKNAAGAYIGFKKDGSVVAFLPNPICGYSWIDPQTGNRVNIGKENETLFEENAICFYKPFPAQKLTIPALFRFIFDCTPYSSRMLLTVTAFFAALVGMLSPKITNIVFSDVLESGNLRILIAAALFAVCVNISVILFESIKRLLNGRIATQTGIVVEAAVMARILNFPAGFFKKFSAGELTSKVQYFNSFCAALFSVFSVTGLTSVMSLIYIVQIFEYAPSLALPALLIMALTLTFSAFSSFLRMKEAGAAMKFAEKKNGMTYALITGIQKIKLAGAEKRAFARWTRLYNEEVKHTYGISDLLILSPTIVMGISAAGTIVLYYTAVKSGISVADYYAFNVA